MWDRLEPGFACQGTIKKPVLEALRSGSSTRLPRNMSSAVEQGSLRAEGLVTEIFSVALQRVGAFTR